MAVWKRRILTVWKRKFWQFGKGNFDGFKKKNFDSLEKEIIDVLERKFFDVLEKEIFYSYTCLGKITPILSASNLETVEIKKFNGIENWISIPKSIQNCQKKTSTHFHKRKSHSHNDYQKKIISTFSGHNVFALALNSIK